MRDDSAEIRQRISDTEIARVRATSIVEVISRYRVEWDPKKTDLRKGDYWACCPFHGERTPSFHAEVHKGRYHCFGCGASGDAIGFVMAHERIGFMEAVRALGAQADPSPAAVERSERRRAAALEDDDRNKRTRVDLGRRIWNEAQHSLTGTLGESYLLARGLEPRLEWPPTLRYVPALRHSDTGLTFPAIVAQVVSADRQPRGCWRIYLAPDGQWKAAVTPNKMGLGVAKGAAARLGPAQERIAVCEGIETALAVMELTAGSVPVWAALSANGMRFLDLPDIVRHVDIYPDGDIARYGEDGKLRKPTGRMAADDLAARLTESGRTHTIQPISDGLDYLDVLLAMKRAEQGRYVA